MMELEKLIGSALGQAPVAERQIALPPDEEERTSMPITLHPLGSLSTDA
jgi:hypothetical protein